MCRGPIRPERGRQRPQVPLDQPLEGDSAGGGGYEGEAEDGGLAAVEGAQLLGDHPPLADQQGGGGTGVGPPRRSFAARVLAVPVPASEPRDQCQMG